MPASGSPKTRIVPDEGLSRPAATLRSVDLPHPVGPTTDTNSPSPTARSTSFTAVYDLSPPGEANVQVMSSKETAGFMNWIPAFAGMTSLEGAGAPHASSFVLGRRL